MADLVDPVAGVIDATCVVGSVAIRVASASTITSATSFFGTAMGGATAAATAASAAI
jgi:hypothetical protein